MIVGLQFVGVVLGTAVGEPVAAVGVGTAVGEPVAAEDILVDNHAAASKIPAYVNT